MAGDGEGGRGAGGWSVEEVDLAGFLLEAEIHEEGTVAMDGLRADAAAAFAGDVFHADFGDEALQVFQEDCFAEGVFQLTQCGAGVFFQKPIEAGKREGLPRIAQGDVGAAVALALEGEHGIRPGFNAATDHARKMHAEKWQRGIGNGINQMPDEMFTSGRQFPIIAAKRNDAGGGVQAGGLGHAVAVQAGAVDDKVGLDLALRGADDLPSAAGANAKRGGVGADLVPNGEDQFRHLPHDSRIVDDALLWHAQSGESGRVGFDLPNCGALEPLQATQSIGGATGLQLTQPHDLGLVDRKDDLPANIVRYPVLAAERHHFPDSLHGQPRLERAGLVVEPAVQNPGVVTTLVTASGGILLQ